SIKALERKKKHRIEIPILCRRVSSEEGPIIHRFANFGIPSRSCPNCVVLCPHSSKYDGFQDPCSSTSFRDHNCASVLPRDWRAIPSPSKLLVYGDRFSDRR